ncbi:glycosyltransferase family 2 protein [Methylacidimicrobium tartarophylax]|uniref:Glycosyltransferase 2-like domain-containing protein n=1 Tax=Methylacidimicrobium tartarophylax TaxID=1041768 RepID=A0A5E6MAR7_9BACT|nr:glycosyltransferase family 2 protein [Methylacidimicrobium tartarophylax]VVM06505.1 hypothetical protein MAMT_01246 [Methylacidimicrobium tartarophylax]
MNVSIVILTYNSEKTIGATVEKALAASDDVHVVDSYSTDRTMELLRSWPVHVVQHPFEDYARQRNWAMRELPIRHPWELHLDADEMLSPELVREILAPDPVEGVDGYFIPRLVCFLGRVLRHGGISPTWHMRLFRRGKGKCEDRLYDQHFFVRGPTGRFHSPIIDNIGLDLSEWTIRHNRWSDAEVLELQRSTEGERISGQWFGNPVERKRALRTGYDRLPIFVRPFLLFGYRYFIRAGILDGIEGFIFYVLQTFWFRFLIDAKQWEARRCINGLPAESFGCARSADQRRSRAQPADRRSVR